MSIRLAVIEKRLDSLESALTYLSISLNSTFPTTGIPFGSIADGLSELHSEIEKYKADKVRVKRNDVFSKHEMIRQDDLIFLVKQYARALAITDACDRVVSTSNSKTAFKIDLSNLTLVSVEYGISNVDLTSHQLLMLVSLDRGVDIVIQETVTVDMETVTYTTQYDPNTHPLVKSRIVNWFYSQVAKHLGSSVWCLPTPDQGDTASRSMVVQELKLRPHVQLVEHLTEVAERFIRWADDKGVLSYGVSLNAPSGLNSVSTVIKVLAHRNEDTEEVVVHLWDYDQGKFTFPKVNVNHWFTISDPRKCDDYDAFVETLGTLPLSRLSRLYWLTSSLRFFEPTVNDTTLSDYDGAKYTVEWVVGDKKELTE